MGFHQTQTVPGPNPGLLSLQKCEKSAVVHGPRRLWYSAVAARTGQTALIPVSFLGLIGALKSYFAFLPFLSGIDELTSAIGSILGMTGEPGRGARLRIHTPAFIVCTCADT